MTTSSNNTQTKPGDIKTIKTLLPYLWEFKGRVLIAMSCLFIAKVATVWVPLLLKDIVDNLDSTQVTILILPLGLLLAYGGLRLANSLFAELRDVVFVNVTQRAIRRIANQVLSCA